MSESSGFDLLGRYFEEDTLFTRYIETVAQGEALRRHKQTIHYGEKVGESLYTHILNGVSLLEDLRGWFELDQQEQLVLFTAYTVHDLNKFEETEESFADLATPEEVQRRIVEFGLDRFFPDYQDYLWDIVELVRGHSGHFNADVLHLDRTRAQRFRLFGGPDRDQGQARYHRLRALIRAVDDADRLHGLDAWQPGRDIKFLKELKAAADTTQYTIFTHQLTEHRGLLSNVIHNAIVHELREQHGLLPLLFYPDGVVYLQDKRRPPAIGDDVWGAIARRVARTLQAFTADQFAQFIDARPLGIRIDAKCLDLGLPFNQILEAVDSIIQRRKFDIETLRSRVCARTRKRASTLDARDPRRSALETLLDAPALIGESSERLRVAELIRTYYILLNEHFSGPGTDAWTALYDLLELPAARRPLYDLFDARQDRAYVLINDVPLAASEVWARIAADGTARLGQWTVEDRSIPLIERYLRATVRLSAGPNTRPAFGDHVAHYVQNQHRQCVQCSSPLPTAPWMKTDVRSEISVNTFSNRLAAGPGEPKKFVCGLCRMQFLIEKLAFREVPGEDVVYLHLFPYSFQTHHLLQGLRANVERVLGAAPEAKAFFLRPEEYLLAEGTDPLLFLPETKAGKPHSNGLYPPIYSELIGNVLIYPINPPGKNATERFVYVVQIAMLLQRQLGLKVLVSASPVPPLGPSDFADLYLDMQPLSTQGLVDAAHFWDREADKTPGNLPQLWKRMRLLLHLKGGLLNPKHFRDPLIEIGRALAVHPLEVFFVAERLLEDKLADDARLLKGQQSSVRARAAAVLLPHIEGVACTARGGTNVSNVSTQLKQLAEIAWTKRLRGRSLEKHSLMVPFDECLRQLGHPSKAFDDEAVRAATVIEIFEYLRRTAGEGYTPGGPKRAAVKTFVDLFFDGLFHGVYGGKRQLLLNDERRLRSAFLFYILEQSTRKAAAPAEAPEAPEPQPDESLSA